MSMVPKGESNQTDAFERTYTLAQKEIIESVLAASKSKELYSLYEVLGLHKAATDDEIRKG